MKWEFLHVLDDEAWDIYGYCNLLNLNWNCNGTNHLFMQPVRILMHNFTGD